MLICCRAFGNAESVVTGNGTAEDETGSISVVQLELAQTLHSLDEQQREHAATKQRAYALEHQCESLGEQSLAYSLLLYQCTIGEGSCSIACGCRANAKDADAAACSD